MKNKLQINKENVKICKAVHEIRVYSVKASDWHSIIRKCG